MHPACRENRTKLPCDVSLYTDDPMRGGVLGDGGSEPPPPAGFRAEPRKNLHFGCTIYMSPEARLVAANACPANVLLKTVVKESYRHMLLGLYLYRLPFDSFVNDKFHVHVCLLE